MVLRALHLCSGYGGFELGLRYAGIDAVTVAHVERDAYASATVVARMAEKRLDLAPIWDDLATFDGAAWRGRVDLITAGLPCQPFSVAGACGGLDDERHLWPMARRIIADVRPQFVVLENVPDVVRAGWLDHVLADLAALGFDAEWGVLSAAAVGATHKRERFWLLAYAESRGREVGERDEVVAGRPTERAGKTQGTGADVAYANGEGRPEVTGSTSGDEGTHGRQPDGGHVADREGQDVADAEGVDEREPHDETRTDARRDTRGDTGRDGEDVADTGGAGLPQRRPGTVTNRTAHTEPAHRFPPAPDDTDGWEEYAGAGGPQPGVRRSTDGPPAWLADALHLGGNGLVPQCAAEAIRQLADRAGVTL